MGNALRIGNRAARVGAKAVTTACPDCCGEGEAYIFACPCGIRPAGEPDDSCTLTEAPCVYIPSGAYLSDAPTVPIIKRLADLIGAVVNVAGRCYTLMPTGSILWFDPQVPLATRQATLDRYGATQGGSDRNPALAVLGATGDVLARVDDCTEASGCLPWEPGRPLIEATPCSGTPGYRLFLCAALPGIYPFGGFCWCVAADGQRWTREEAEDVGGLVRVPGDPDYPSRVMIRQNGGGGGVHIVPADTCCYCEGECVNGSGWERVGPLWSLIDHCCGRRAGMVYRVDLSYRSVRTGFNGVNAFRIETTFRVASQVDNPAGGSTLFIEQRTKTFLDGILVDDTIGGRDVVLAPQCCIRSPTGDRVFPWFGQFIGRPDGVYADRVSGVVGREQVFFDVPEGVAAWGLSLWGWIPLPTSTSFGENFTISGSSSELVRSCTSGAFSLRYNTVLNPGDPLAVTETLLLDLEIDAVWPQGGCSGCGAETLEGMLP